MICHQTSGDIGGLFILVICNCHRSGHLPSQAMQMLCRNPSRERFCCSTHCKRLWGVNPCDRRTISDEGPIAVQQRKLIGTAPQLKLQAVAVSKRKPPRKPAMAPWPMPPLLLLILGVCVLSRFEVKHLMNDLFAGGIKLNKSRRRINAVLESFL